MLFVAHREEILNQALDTFRRIRPEARLGHYTGEMKDPDADVVFASIQTLSRREHLERFSPDAFDYIVVDEFHHAAAASYRKLIAYFRPKFLLGLTATPERSDGGDLLALCQQNLVYRCDLVEGVRKDLLAPFHYFGVPDDVDYTNIPWRSTRFDEEALTTAVATQRRAENALEQFRTRGGTARARLLRLAATRRLHGGLLQRHEASAPSPSTPGRHLRHGPPSLEQLDGRRARHRLRRGHVQRRRRSADARHRDDAAADGVEDSLAPAVRPRTAEGAGQGAARRSSTTSATTGCSC